jgi:hypothetical protein
MRLCAVRLCADCAVLVECDQDASRARARTWAVIQGLRRWGYYFDSHAGMVAITRRFIGTTFESTDKQLS